jgi:hypothetical protein
VGVVAVVKTLKMLAALTIGISVAFLGLSVTLAFGMFAWLGVPVLVVGLGLLSAAVEEIERH